jgi:CYTH domain-containing protein
MEIERKYAIDKFPSDLTQYQYKKIEQGYLCHKPIVRIRKSNENYILTYKSKIGLEENVHTSAIVNQEVELPLTKEAYQTLRSKTEGNIIYKTRYLVPLNDGLMAEIDIFEQQLQGLVIVEVEFADEKSADKFIKPDWFGKELSADKRYSNYYLSTISSYEELGI